MSENRIDLNRATKEELIALPGIGEVLAERILAARPFERVEDLTRVPGIRPSLVEALAPRLTVGEAAAVEEAVPAAEEAPAPAAAAVEEAAPAAEEAPAPEAAAVEEAVPAAEAAGSPAASQPHYVTRREAWLLALTTGLLGFLLAFVLSLGVLHALNGTLHYAGEARYQGTERQVLAMQERLNRLEMTADALQRQISDLKGVASQVQQLADQQQTLADEQQDMAQQLADLDANLTALAQQTARFQTFLTGLQDLLNGLLPTPTPAATSAPPTATPTSSAPTPTPTPTP